MLKCPVTLPSRKMAIFAEDHLTISKKTKVNSKAIPKIMSCWWVFGNVFGALWKSNMACWKLPHLVNDDFAVKGFI